MVMAVAVMVADNDDDDDDDDITLMVIMMIMMMMSTRGFELARVFSCGLLCQGVCGGGEERGGFGKEDGSLLSVRDDSDHEYASQVPLIIAKWSLVPLAHAGKGPI